MYPYGLKFSLQVTHPSIDPEMICSELGLDPEVSWKAGARRKNPKGKLLTGNRKETYCCFDLHLPNKNTEEFENAIKYWNRKFAKHKIFLNRIRSEGGTVDYFVGLFVDRNSGVTLDHSLLFELVNLGIGVSFDVYGSELSRRKSRIRAETSFPFSCRY